MPKVRVDFFKPTGKWYTTEEIEWTGVSTDIYKSFSESLYAHLRNGDSLRLDDMVAVCLGPAHDYQHPVMMPVDEIFKHLQTDESFTESVEHTEDPSEIIAEG